MADNGGKLARSSTLKLFKLGSNHCADDPMKKLKPSEPKKCKVERGGKVRGRGGREKGNRRAGPVLNKLDVKGKEPTAENPISQ